MRLLSSFKIDKNASLGISFRSRFLVYLYVINIYISLFAPFSYYHLFKGSVQIFSLLTTFYILFTTKSLILKKKVFAIISVIVLSQIYINFQSFVFNGTTSSYQVLIIILSICSYFLIPERIRKLILDLFIRSFAVILFLSVAEYAIYILLHKGIVLSMVQRLEADGSQFFYHLCLSIVKIDNIIPRYQFLLDEPGKLGTFLAFLIFLTHGTKYKKQQIIFMLAGIITFSLAFYILLTLITVYILILKRPNLSIVISVLLIAGLSYYFLYDVINQRIFERISNFEGRDTPAFRAALIKMFQSADCLVGYGLRASIPDDASGNTVGVLRELYQIGVIGVLVRLGHFFYCIIKQNGVSLRVIYFLMIFIVSYYQRTHMYDTMLLVLFFPFPDLEEKQKN